MQDIFHRSWIRRASAGIVRFPGELSARCREDHLTNGRTIVTTIENLKIKIFADGADTPEMLEMYSKPFIKGLTTNPTLMRKAGISNYRGFAREILAQIRDKPLSFEVVCDESWRSEERRVGKECR